MNQDIHNGDAFGAGTARPRGAKGANNCNWCNSQVASSNAVGSRRVVGQPAPGLQSVSAQEFPLCDRHISSHLTRWPNGRRQILKRCSPLAACFFRQPLSSFLASQGALSTHRTGKSVLLPALLLLLLLAVVRFNCRQCAAAPAES